MKPLPFSNVWVDFFGPLPERSPALFFLSHTHADHLEGLHHGWKEGNIFCSQVCRRLLLRKFPSLERYTVPLELHVTYHFDMANPSRSPSVDPPEAQQSLPPSASTVPQLPLSVTLLDANHCVGSCMFVFQSPSFGKVLHTGDFRYRPQMAREIEFFTSGKGEDGQVKKEEERGGEGEEQGQARSLVDALHLDNTFGHPRFDFPSRKEVAASIEARVDGAWPAVVLLGTETLGKEELCVALARRFETQVVVLPDRLKILEAAEKALEIEREEGKERMDDKGENCEETQKKESNEAEDLSPSSPLPVSLFRLPTPKEARIFFPNSFSSPTGALGGEGQRGAPEEEDGGHEGVEVESEGMIVVVSRREIGQVLRLVKGCERYGDLKVLAFQLSGWCQNDPKPKGGNSTSFDWNFREDENFVRLPYSLHSNFFELCKFTKEIRPKEVIFNTPLPQPPSDLSSSAKGSTYSYDGAEGARLFAEATGTSRVVFNLRTEVSAPLSASASSASTSSGHLHLHQHPSLRFQAGQSTEAASGGTRRKGRQQLYSSRTQRKAPTDHNEQGPPQSIHAAVTFNSASCRPDPSNSSAAGNSDKLPASDSQDAREESANGIGENHHQDRKRCRDTEGEPSSGNSPLLLLRGQLRPQPGQKGHPLFLSLNEEDGEHNQTTKRVIA
uniref:Protein artemis n=1 Tax=Chromera velia CCMP2878 TaxID=1169474 RepID=A0A0G4HHD8_9ALVE|eukprot:Cvel_6868.t1-p1 / transcript=Cvel_6868.t1 / gene=Cvel_6868 / organism=Chromera_velia_CCMP2878 / gene_product=5' exonuclease Apollo, putative / transcript_product=5' exonuclease Apollo, putative / location=Cvel_scaffold347:21242-27039(+) / protein_length=670 / sequence_SO=supercontig / SO=protein_coding / is_pseudo=false